jgi:hypothetical protein
MKKQKCRKRKSTKLQTTRAIVSENHNYWRQFHDTETMTTSLEACCVHGTVNQPAVHVHHVRQPNVVVRDASPTVRP